jgi:multicomponent Na+:H+ antiporter subunit E
MTFLMWNILLALSWAGLTEEVTAMNLTIGFVMGFVILFLVRGLLRPTRYFLKVYQVFDLAAVFAWELLLANLRIAYEVITPTHYMKPGVVAIPLDVKTDVEITLLANLITLTPGTLSLDVSQDRRVLYIHAMYVEDVEELRRSIKDGFEKRVMEVLR